MMKKKYAVLMTAAMLTGAITVTALAEGPGNGGGMQMSGQQMPQMDGQQTPQMMGRGPEDGFGFISFEDRVTDGTISQETFEAIKKFMEENKPELPEGMKEGERPEPPEGAAGGERPELPEGAAGEERSELSEDAANGERPEMKEGEGPDLLKDLLENGIITQEEYDALAASRKTGGANAPAGNQAESTNEANKTTGA